MNLPEADRPLLIMSLPPRYREQFAKLWPFFSHPHQRPPALAQGGAPWTTWLILGGRGAGKTRAGA
jgi:phage terminase large subunit-like protein